MRKLLCFISVLFFHNIICCQAGVAPLADKTLVAWVRLDDLQQRGAGVISVQDGNEFDAIAFGEAVEGRWAAGSFNTWRSLSPDAQKKLPEETAPPTQWIQVAIVYRGNQMEIWRQGELLSSYKIFKPVTYSANSDLYLGLRCMTLNPAKKEMACRGYLKGAIDEARVYNVALDGSTIASLKPGVMSNPKPQGCWTFETGAIIDTMGNYPTGRLLGTARIKDGALVLDGHGYVLIPVSNRQFPNYILPSGIQQAGFYTPPHQVGGIWDTWLYWHEGTYYLYYITWHSHDLATSRDGVHWDYQGVAVAPRPEAQWMGTGQIWKSPDFEKNGLWVSNYSEAVQDKQDIMFATSKDLINWTKVSEEFRFVQDTRWYKEKGRWDCIDAVAGDDGWLYGYFTATPDPGKVKYPHCGFGFARSRDGIRWEALPPIPGNLNGEVGGIQKIGEKYYLLLGAGALAVGDKLQGPFAIQKKNPNIFGGDIYFPRFFHTAPGGPLVDHFYWEGVVHAAPLKAIDIDAEGIVRLKWWPGNEKIKAQTVDAKWTPMPSTNPEWQVRMLEQPLEPLPTYVLEGTVSDVPAQISEKDRRGLYFDTGEGKGQCLLFACGMAQERTCQADGSAFSKVLRTSNRSLDLGATQRFRLVMRSDMAELYINDYLMNLKRVKNFNGRIGLIGSAADVKLYRSR